jgi:hypothetical protein
MGKSVSFKYVMKVTANVAGLDIFGPDKKMTNAELEAYRVAMNQSFNKGGVNEVKVGTIPHISKIVLIHQASGKVVATATMPMFEVM